MISVIFDMDGTLLDTQSICIPAWEYAGRLQGINGVGDALVQVCGMNQAGWSGYLKKHFPCLDLESFIPEMRKYIIKNLVVRYKAGGEEILKFLKENDIKIGLASGSSHESIDHHLNVVGGRDYFSAIVGGSDVENGKPSPDIFLLAAEKMGAKPSDCIVLEDAENGIKAAVNAGMRCIGIPDTAPFSEETKKLMLKEMPSFFEVIEFLKEEIEKTVD